MSSCPHCGSSANADPSRSLRFRCGVCGGPVVPTRGPRTRKDIELASLVAAQRARAVAFGWTAAAAFVGAAFAMTLGLAFLLLWAGSKGTALLLGGIAAGEALFVVVAVRRARLRNADARANLDDAWERAAEDIATTRGATVTAPELALAMQTDAKHAEALLSKLSAQGRARVRVRDDAELVYTTAVAADVPGPNTEVEPNVRGPGLGAKWP